MWTVGQGTSVGRQWTGVAASEGVWSARVGVAPRRLSEAGTPGGRAQTQRDWRPAWRDARGKKGNLEGAGAQWRRI